MGKKLSVLHIDTEYGWRGGQQQVVYLLEEMSRQDYHTALVCLPQSSLEKRCLENQIPHFKVRMWGEIDVLAGLRIARICKKHDFNILHLHSAHALAMGLWTKLFYPPIKLIAVRRVDFHIKHNWFSQIKYKNPYLNRIICVSDGIKKILLQDGISPEKLVTIHSGVDLDKFQQVLTPANFRTKLGVPENHILVGTVAAMVGHKDYPNLLRAARIVMDNNDQITLCAVGNGNDETGVLKLAQDLNLGKRFLFVGFREDIGNFLKSFDIFVLSSKQEGLGTSILDAQAVGLPVIACDTGGIPEMIVHQQNGLLVPPENEQALADAILLLAANKQLRQKLGRNALQMVKKFDIRLTSEKNLQLYHEIWE